ncbi:hypothetical protein K488DRAFT_89588 [Vararia minispora EC-137]|uniref:Uncharacterized protein n=1 Tax=Vararia minispora EC-137 TaxID=1314806 RepID=A0ACB8QAH5_9AGAM|nr:hypothetical protein K488DRAFT_89588 [Vararia minispora EC-137]
MASTYPEYSYSDSAQPAAMYQYQDASVHDQYIGHEHYYYAAAEDAQSQCDASQCCAPSNSVGALGHQAYYYDQTEHLSSAQGLGHLPYLDQPPVEVPAAPPELYPAKPCEQGYGLVAPTGAPVAAALGYHTHAHIQPAVPYHATQLAQFTYAQHQYVHQQQTLVHAHQQHLYQLDTAVPRAPSYVSPAHSTMSSSSSLAHALRSPVISPRAEMTETETDIESPSIASGTPDPIEYESPAPEDIGYTFVLETGPPPPRSGHAGDGLGPPPGPPRKKRSPPKGPRKEQGFLACYFCRGRKIACNAPPPGSGSSACE